MEYDIKHNEANNRFETHIDGDMALVDYNRRDNVLIVTHTEVPSKLEGRGIATALTKALLDYARSNKLEVNAICPYTKVYIQRHPEYNDIVVGL